MIAASRKPATLRELVEAGARELQWSESAARENPLQEASVLLMAAVGCERSHLVTRGGEFAPTREAELFWSLVSQRATGVPLQLLLGETGFHAVTLRVERGVFIPRPETELLVDEAIAAVRERLEGGRGSHVLDLCTGTGAVAIAVAAQFRERSDVHILAADWNPQAVRLARRNVEDNGVGAMIEVRRSNLYSALADQEGRINVIVSNPPYVEPAVSADLPVEVRLGDPKDALFDPEGGTGFHRRIAGRGRDFLVAGGVLAMEIGATQGAKVAVILAEAGYEDVRVLPDLAGRDRVVRGNVDAILLKGNGPLRGEVRISGSKNTALPILTAAILFDEEVVVDNVPDLRDIDTLLELLGGMGVEAAREGSTLRLNGAGLRSVEAPYDLVRQMRASIYVLGPLLARVGRARVSLPGGCAWGPRPVDLHVLAMETLGATVEVEHGYLVASAPPTGLTGDVVRFPISSVGATCNALLAAATADGVTTLENAAAEPEVVALADFLAACGARIEGQGTRVIRIEGVEELQPARTSIIPDRIEAGTFLVAAAITRGDLVLKGVCPGHLDSVIEALRSAGCELDVLDGAVRCRGTGPPVGMDVVTAPYPGFPTDMQAQFMALAATGQGVSVITDTIYPDRFTHVAELARLGADIRLDGNKAVIHPCGGLSGARVMATDLRASAALILAGLVADGETLVSRVYHIDRGYERIEEKLRAVGARIERVTDAD